MAVMRYGIVDGHVIFLYLLCKILIFNGAFLLTKFIDFSMIKTENKKERGHYEE